MLSPHPERGGKGYPAVIAYTNDKNGNVWKGKKCTVEKEEDEEEEDQNEKYRRKP